MCGACNRVVFKSYKFVIRHVMIHRRIGIGCHRPRSENTTKGLFASLALMAPPDQRDIGCVP